MPQTTGSPARRGTGTTSARHLPKPSAASAFVVCTLHMPKSAASSAQVYVSTSLLDASATLILACLWPSDSKICKGGSEAAKVSPRTSCKAPQQACGGPAGGHPETALLSSLPPAHLRALASLRFRLQFHCIAHAAGRRRQGAGRQQVTRQHPCSSRTGTQLTGLTIFLLSLLAPHASKSQLAWRVGGCRESRSAAPRGPSSSPPTGCCSRCSGSGCRCRGRQGRRQRMRQRWYMKQHWLPTAMQTGRGRQSARAWPGRDRRSALPSAPLAEHAVQADLAQLRPHGGLPATDGGCTSCCEHVRQAALKWAVQSALHTSAVMSG